MAEGGTIECSIKIARNISVSEFSTARANKDGVLRLLLIVQMKSPIILIYSHPFFSSASFSGDCPPPTVAPRHRSPRSLSPGFMVHSEKERKEDLDDKDDRPNFFSHCKKWWWNCWRKIKATDSGLDLEFVHRCSGNTRAGAC